MISSLIFGLFSRLHSRERGQDTAEYIVMTGVVVSIIIAIVWLAYQGALSSAIGTLSDLITDWAPGGSAPTS